MTFNVEVVLKGRDFAVTEAVTVSHGDPATWNEAAVYDVLVEVLRTIDRVQNPGNETDRMVVLRGFSWIVEPVDDEVVIAMEIPMGAAVAGPFKIEQGTLDGLISRVLKAERASTQTVH
jgi:hypothetical protein